MEEGAPKSSETAVAVEGQISSNNAPQTLPSGSRVEMVRGDIFAAPPNSVLIHACNCQGSWGAGIALAFKTKYPRAYQVYHSHCTSRTEPSALLGTTLLIPPQPGDPESHWIACLFTSVHYGRRVDNAHRILESTAEAFEHCINQIANAENEGSVPIGELHACKINSGRFGVDWESSKAIMAATLAEEGKSRVVTVYEFDEEPAGGSSSRGGGRGRGGRGRGRGRGGLERGQQQLRF